MKIKNALVIADLHLGSDVIAQYRGYKGNWDFWLKYQQIHNAQITYDEQPVFILGDIATHRDWVEIICGQLKGKLHFVLGNHDTENVAFYAKQVARTKGTCNAMVMLPHQKVIMSHIPVHPCFFDGNKAGWKNIHGHCVDSETEILTVEGFKKFSEVAIGQKVYSLNKDTQELELDCIREVITNINYRGKAYELKSKGVSQVITDKHRVAFTTIKSKSYLVEEADIAFKRSTITLYKSFNYNKSAVNLSDDLLTLYICLAADGNITPSNLCRFGFIKQRKIDYTEALLNRLKISYTKNKQKANKTTIINFKMPSELLDWNIKGLDKKLLQASKQQCEIIREAYKNTDGYLKYILTSKKEEVNLLQHLFTLNGYICTVSKRVNHGFSNLPSYQLNVTEGLFRQVAYLRDKVTEIESFNGLMWCVKTSNQNFIARRKGTVYLTGNCHTTNINSQHYFNVSFDQAQQNNNNKLFSLNTLLP